MKASDHSKYLKKRYGISSAQWHRIYLRQKGLCPICLGPLRKPGNKEGRAASAIDHDHKSGRVRGLLDYYCNRRIVGRHRDTEKLKRLVAYLDDDFDGRKI